MKVNKLFSHSSILRVIYGTLILLPMFAIFGRVIYTQSNQNAHLSYSDTYITSYDNVLSANVLQVNERYSINLKTFCDYGYTHQFIRLASGYFNYSSPSFEWNTYIKRDVDKLTPQQQLDIVGFQIFYAQADILGLRLMDIDSNTIKNIQGNINTYYQNLNQTMYFTLTSLGTFNVGSYTQDFASNSMYMITKTIDSLDNAFEYSIKSFVDDNNFSIDFFDWFDDLFLKQSNTHNAVYLNFANWYMNYSLLVTAGYFIFFVLMWIFTMLRRLMDRFLDRNYGGF